LVSSNSDSCNSPESTRARTWNGFERGDELDPLLGQRLGVRLGDHPAVADDHDMLDPEPL